MALKNYIAEAAERIVRQAEANKGYEYESYWTTVNHALARSGYMKVIGLRTFGLFMVIRSFANINNEAFPKLETLKRLTGLSVNTIRKDLDQLEKHGWIRISGKRQLKGKYEANCYLILQRDYVRGSKDQSFRKKPVSRFDKGH